VERDGKYWLVHVVGPGFDHYTQAKSLAQVTPMAADLVAAVTGQAVGSFDIQVEVGLPGDAQAHIGKARKLRQAAAAAQHEAADEAKAAAKELATAGLTFRDIGAVLGVSYQRAHQLATA
jgi:hypothetical protein